MFRSKSLITLSISQALFTLGFLLFFFTVLNGYVLNLVSGYHADFWLVTIGVIVEFSAIVFIARRWITVERDSLELTGFLVVVGGVWIYFIAASLPTLLPPTQSEDAVRVYLQVLFTYPEGKLVSWYPAGGTFFVATLAHWLGWQPLRVLHPTAALFLALSAGAVYGMMCALLPPKRISKVFALAAPALLFVPWSYFAGIINWEQYFFAQAFAQFFTLAALWFTASYTRQPHPLLAGLVGASLLGVTAAYPVLVVLPFALFAMVVFARSLAFPRRGGGQGEGRGALVIFIALMLLAAIALEKGGILEFRAAQNSITPDVGAGGVTNPSLETLGGPIFLLLALIGAPLAWRANSIGRTILAFLLAWALQYVALLLLQPVLKISGYRVDKTFYILVFPFAILAAFALARALERVTARFQPSPRALSTLGLGTVLLLCAGIAIARPPKFFSPLTEAELETAQWAKEHLDTYQINYLDPLRIRAYWLAFGIWRETLPNEWFQWIPPGTKLGPASFDEWLADPAWAPYLLVSDAGLLGAAPVRPVYSSGASVIVRKEFSAAALPTPLRISRWHFGSTLQLNGFDLPREKFSPGDTIALTTFSESIYPPPATVAWRVQLIDRQGNLVGQAEGDPFANKYPVQRWPQGRGAREVWNLLTDARASPGVYELHLGLFRREGGEFIEAYPVVANGLGKPMSTVPLAKMKIPFPAPSAEELRAAQSLGARVGENFSLMSYALKVDRAARRVRLTLYWQGIAKSQNDYTVFVHLLDASGKVIAQIDRQPLEGNYPTSVWDPQEIVKDEYALAIPADASAPLTMEIGMYAQPSLKRLPVGESDHVILDLGF